MSQVALSPFEFAAKHSTAGRCHIRRHSKFQVCIHKDSVSGVCCWRLRISGKLGSFTRIASQNQCIVLPAMGGKHLSFHKSMISFRNPPPPSLSPSPSLPLPPSPALTPFPLFLVNTSTSKRMSGCSCLRFPSFPHACDFQAFHILISLACYMDSP